MPRGGGGSGRSSSGGGFSSHSRSSSGRSSSGSSYRSSSSTRSSSGGGFSSHSRSSSGRGSSSSSYRSSPSRSGPQRRSSGSGFGSPSYPRNSRPQHRSVPPVIPIVTGGRRAPMSPRAGRTAAQRLKKRSGCLGIVLVVLFLLLLLGSSSETKKQNQGGTVLRTPLAASETTAIDSWYQDDWTDWIDACSEKERNAMIEDFRYFYTKTGVQPFLWILGENGAFVQDAQALEEASRDRYDALFSDTGHLLIAFREYPNASGDYISGCFAGEAAQRVMDAQAREILLDAIDACYDREDYSEAQLFGAAVRMTADAIMQTGSSEESNPYITLLQLGIFLFVCFLIAYYFGRRKEKKALALQPQTAPETAPEAGPGQAGEERAVKCPNCGASMKIRTKTTGQCSYCGTYIYVSQDGQAEIAQV